MSLHIEFKKFEQPAQIRIDPARTDVHTRDNLSVTPAAGWATALAAQTALAFQEMIVVFNRSLVDVRVANSNDVTPLRFHIIPAGAQRAISYVPTLPIRTALL